MYAQLGNIKFEGLKGFTSLGYTQATSYAEIARINRKPNLQRTGETLQALSISMLLHADFTNVERDMAELEQARKDGDSLPLVLGNGSVLGEFLILSISRQIRKTASDGSTIYLTAELELKEYDTGDRLERLAITARENAYANSIEKIVPTKEVAIADSEGVEAGKLSESISIEAERIDGDVEAAQTNVDARPAIYARIGASVDLVSIAALELANKVRAIEAEIANAQTIINNAESVYLFASNLKAAVVNADINEINSANTSLQAANALLEASACVLVQFIAARKI